MVCNEFDMATKMNLDQEDEKRSEPSTNHSAEQNDVELSMSEAAGEDQQPNQVIGWVCCSSRASPSRCIMDGFTVQPNSHDKTLPKHYCNVCRYSKGKSPGECALHGGVCASLILDGNKMVCGVCYDEAARGATSSVDNGDDDSGANSDATSGAIDNGDDGKTPAVANNDTSDTSSSENRVIYFQYGKRVKAPESGDVGGEDDTITISFNIDNDDQPQDLYYVDESIDDEELNWVVEVLELSADAVAKFMKKPFCLNLSAEQHIGLIGNILEEFNHHLGSFAEWSIAYPPSTIETRKMWIKDGNSKRAGTVGRYTIADVLIQQWLFAIFSELTNMLYKGYSRQQRGLWYYLNGLMKKKWQIPYVKFNKIIDEVCNITGLVRCQLNLVSSPTSMAVGPVVFFRKGEEFDNVYFGEEKYKVIRLPESYDFNTPHPITLDEAFMKDYYRVDARDTTFELQMTRSHVPKYALCCESSDVAFDLFGQPEMWNRRGMAGFIIYYNGNPKSYSKFFVWRLQKLGVRVQPLVSCKYIIDSYSSY